MATATLNVRCMVRAAPLRRDSGASRLAATPRRTAASRCSLSVAAAGKSYKITLLPGDGIGPEIMKVAVDCLNIVVRARRRPHAAQTLGSCTFSPAGAATPAAVRRTALARDASPHRAPETRARAAIPAPARARRAAPGRR